MNWIGITQGLYYLATALWPFFSLHTFVAVTGPKTDIWLVKTVAALLIVIGIALLVGSIESPTAIDTICLGFFSALALAAIDIYYARRKVIRKIYLGDAILEVLFVLWWACAYLGKSRFFL